MTEGVRGGGGGGKDQALKCETPSFPLYWYVLQLVLQVVGGELVTVTRGAVERKAGTGCQLELTDHLQSEGAGGRLVNHGTRGGNRSS